ncbi:fibroblast growth factor 1-like [Actinia tenebrosa]|uniref:Fibroblast growth factor 1-like n=1 Tax=Actinia tenebrosa TaxID=6105 RepID=A0A6P8IKM1_ACTTE|nr:fibroblast growth factor 1-like [Actinia tenebrosa]
MVKNVHLVLLIVLVFYDPLIVSKKLRNKTGISSRFRNKTKNQATKVSYNKNTKWPSPRINNNWMRSTYITTKKPTNREHCKIFCRSGYHLQILPNGLVRGTVMQSSKHVLFEMQSFGPSLVKIKSVATGRYLSMRRDGSLRATRHSNSRETIFKETHEMNAFHSYASHKYYRETPHDMLVGIKRNGEVKRATRTMHGQTATQFLVIKT